MSVTVGVIGLGIMGMAMAKNARKAGFDVVVTSRSSDKRKAAEEAGLRVVTNPRSVAESSETIVVMVTDPAAVHAVLNGSGGIFSVDVAGKTLIQMSTLDEPSTMEFSHQAQQRRMSFLDCPVAGSRVQVEAAQLILLAGGASDVIEQQRPFLMSVGKKIVHAGGIGKGTALKLCMNLIVAQMTTALCESVALARAQKLDPQTIFEAIRNSPALNCGYFQIKEKNLLENTFAPAFSLANMLKDVRFMNAAALQNNLELPVARAVQKLMEKAASDGFSDNDLTVLVKALQ